MEGQMSIFDIEYKFSDLHYDRNEKPHKVPDWMSFERCENCIRWKRYPVNEQPPSGWGVVGWCAEHNQKVKEASYCQCWENKFLGDMKYG